MYIQLSRLIQSSCAWGCALGEAIRGQLMELLLPVPDGEVSVLSLEGVACLDVSFARASVIALAKDRRGRYGFCLIDVGSSDLLENWAAAALMDAQPLMVYGPDGVSHLVGPEPASGFVVVGWYGTILTSPDGSTWTAQSSGTSQILFGVAWLGSRFVAVGWYTILTSP